MSRDIDQKILLEYFFKKPDTVIDKDLLSQFSCICYDLKEQKLYANTKRFIKELAQFTNQNITSKDVDNTIKKSLNECFTIHEELVRCDLACNEGVTHFYIAVIGIDFFQIENKFRKKFTTKL